MRAAGHFEKVIGKEKMGESRTGVCELCGAECDIDPESGECRCPVCDNQEE